MEGGTFVPGIDAWGNLNEITNTQCSVPTWSQLSTVQNKISGFCYDIAGNMLGTGGCPSLPYSPYYVYDAENRLRNLTITAAPQYLYDGDGKRVIKTGIGNKLYWTGTASDTITETSLSGTPSADYIYFNGKRVARVDLPGGAVRYYFSDHLGTASVVTDNLGVIKDESDYYPYGGERVITDSDSNRYKFTGKERDSESGLDFFGARHDSSALGRFMTADPMGGHKEDPQTLNRYAYVRNNPLSLTDPTGLDFYLQCTPSPDIALTCQQRRIGGTDKEPQMAWVQGVTGENGFTATQIGNDANGNLVDRTTGTGAYTADATGSGVQLSNDGGATSATGMFLNKDVKPTGNQLQSYNTVVQAGNLPGFLFTFTNSKMEANQTAAGFLASAGT